MRQFIHDLLRNLKYLWKTTLWIIKYKKQLVSSTEEFCSKLDINSNIEYEVFITNMNGGGTWRYCENYFLQHKNIILIQNYSYKKDFGFIIKNIDNGKIIVSSFILIKQLLKLKFINRVTINTLVTAKCCFDFIDILTNLNVPLCYMVHDYYCICPTINLVKNGKFCKLESCYDNNKCLKKLSKNFKGFIVCDSYEEWHSNWNKLLKKVDEIRCFSKSSKDLLLNAYPTISESKITILPHDMSYCKFSPITIYKRKLKIGIVGAITSTAKGGDVLKSFLDYLRKEQKSTTATIIGTCAKKFQIKATNIKYLGTYKQEMLEEILLKEEINAIFFPSVCPETFSYLVSELITMNIPIVSFNIGAQGEKILNYKKGMLLSISASASEIFDALKTVSATNNVKVE